jgi:hypothetical protein
MPVASDWRSASTANELMRLDRDQFAVEFLRRNPVYADDYRNTQEHIASGSVSQDAGMARLARQWGLIFPACTRHPCMGVARPVAAGAFACRCRRCSGA